MSSCRNSLAVFHARKILFSNFSETCSNAVRPESVRNLSSLKNRFNCITSTRNSSTNAINSRFQLENFICKNGISSVRCISSSSRRDTRFVQFSMASGGISTGPQRLGALLSGPEGGEEVVIDISGVDTSIPDDMVSFLKAGPEKLKKANRVVAEGRSVLELSRVKLLPPITNPDKVACVGLNYRDHCEEQKVPLPQDPIFFSKWSSCITGPHDDIPYPTITKNLDWEVEVALIIGKRAHVVSPASAMEYVFGMCVAQDITARDWQGKGARSRNGGQWLISKATDSSCPLGPAIVQLSSIPDVNSMSLRCSVNGELKQDGNTSNMIFPFEKIVSFLSHCCTLLPGDVILTGTPAGVGVFKKPPEYLKIGDIIESEIEGIGKLRNVIIEG